MTRGMPSMVALLGLFAIAGYQHRDKFAAAFAGRKQGSTNEAGPDRQGSLFDKLGGLLASGTAGSVVSGGLGELVERFKQIGLGPTADSWVSTGPNQPLGSAQFEQAVGPEVLDTLSQHTGLSREELLVRLTRDLPAAVDSFTPTGRLPNEDEATRLIQ